MARRALQAEGFTVTTSDTSITLPADLLRKIKPDLVLLDVNIPRLSGTDTLSFIREHNLEQGTRFILCSVTDPTELERLAGTFGADGWIYKGAPFESAAFVEKVKDFLSGLNS